MNRRHVKINNPSDTSFSSFLSEKWLQHNLFLKKRLSIFQMKNLSHNDKRVFPPGGNAYCNVARNVSSIELDDLLYGHNSPICSSKKYNCSNVGDFLKPYTRIFDYSRITVQRASCQNKGCMCKPIVDGKPDCQIELKVEDPQTTLPNTTENQTSSIPSDAPTKSQSTNTTDRSKPPKKSKPTKFKKQCTPNPCNPCPSHKKFCVPANFEQLLQEAGDEEFEFIHCKSRDRCTCKPYNVEDGVTKGLKLPGKNICVQSTEAQKPKKPKKSSSNEVCCFCFKRKKKKPSEKCVQTCKEKCLNKICQKGESKTCACAPIIEDTGEQPNLEPTPITSDKVTPVTSDKVPLKENVKSIWLCSRCGKIYVAGCKNKCPQSSCARNTIILPQSPGAGLSDDQTDMLKTLIKMEAKQNYRQIDNILQELNEQKNEIKRLTDMYNSISNVQKTKNNVRIRESDDGPQNNATVFICEGCELDMNKNILRALKVGSERDENRDNAKYITSGWDPTSTPKSDKYMKNMMNKRKRVTVNQEREIQTKYISEKAVQTKFIDCMANKKKKIGKIEPLVSDSDNSRSADQSMSKLNGKLETEKPIHFVEDNEIKKELDKKDSDTQSSKCSFIKWCKKSFTSLKQNQSKDIIKRHYQYLQNKLNECKKSLINLKDKYSKNGLKCNYQYVQDNTKCKKSATNLKEKCQQNFNNQYLKNKMTQCKEKTKEINMKPIVDPCVNYRKK